MGDCVFCEIVAGGVSCEKVFEGDDFIVIKDVNPKVEGHLLVISKEHYGGFVDMPFEFYGGMLKVVKVVVEKLGVKDFNLVLNNGKLAGQVVPHLHLHILPRREGDGFRLNV